MPGPQLGGGRGASSCFSQKPTHMDSLGLRNIVCAASFWRVVKHTALWITPKRAAVVQARPRVELAHPAKKPVPPRGVRGGRWPQGAPVGGQAEATTQAPPQQLAGAGPGPGVPKAKLHRAPRDGQRTFTPHSCQGGLTGSLVKASNAREGASILPSGGVWASCWHASADI